MLPLSFHFLRKAKSFPKVLGCGPLSLCLLWRHLEWECAVGLFSMILGGCFWSLVAGWVRSSVHKSAGEIQLCLLTCLSFDSSPSVSVMIYFFGWCPKNPSIVTNHDPSPICSGTIGCPSTFSSCLSHTSIHTQGFHPEWRLRGSNADNLLFTSPLPHA